VEAKRPSVALQNDQNAAFQLRRYGYSAGLALSILTNFAHLAIYDCRIQPDEHDHPKVARYRFYTYQQYLEKWDEIVALFSREAVFNGSLNQFETTNKPKRGAIPIEKAFLQEISKWREYLAHGFFAANKGLSQEDLNFAVQMTINRLLFLRICEDHGIEPYRSLQKLLPEQDSSAENDHSIYPKLCLRFQEADLRYNAGLFHFGPQKGRPSARDTLTLNLRIHNESLRKIIEGLDPELCPYAFQVIPVEILGQIYEQFLGKVITMTDKGLAIEDKPEVRKAGGVYYTPQYIVDYIVRQTLGPLLADQTPETIANLTILDPACGSGSFLLGAYRYLLAWYEQWYQENEAAKWQSQGLLVQKKGEWRISRKKRSEILCDHIFGVDKDAQAVEVAKFSLFLKYLEEETEEVIQTTPHSLLPDLDGNIKCGNSLIGPDFKATESVEIQQINPFDWETEFSKIMQAGGFDVVLGNPPYVLIANKNEKTYLQSQYRLCTGKPDLYRYFIEQSHRILKEKGRFGFIIPNTILTIPASKDLRHYLLNEGGIAQIVSFQGRVFDKVSVNNILIFTQKNCISHSIEVIEDESEVASKKTLEEAMSKMRLIERENWLKSDQFLFTLVSSSEVDTILHKLQTNSVELVSVAKYTLGMQVYHNSIHTQQEMKDRISHSDQKKDESFWPESGGRNIQRYYFIEKFRSHVSYEGKCYSKISWKLCSEPRLLVREILGKTLICTLSTSIHIPNKSVIIITSDKIELRYLLGLLNSSLISFYVRGFGEKGDQRLFPRISLTTLRKLPIRTINFADPQEKAQHDQLVSLVEKQLELHQKLAVAQTPHQKTLLERQINATDKAIDSLVYELYGLNAAEIALIEAATL
jgi:hypothetical protein